jgi:probable addiction module antidote protein
MKQKITLSKFDPVDYLDNQESIEAYLESAFETNDAAHITKAIGDAMRAQGMLKTAQKTGLDRAGLYRSFSTSKGGDPRLSTLTKIIDSFGYHLSLTPKTALHQVGV